MGDVKTLGVRRIEELYRDYHHQLFGFFVRKGLDEGTAEDLSQEVFLRLLRSGKDIDGDGYARNLVYRVAQNLLIDHFRKNNGTVRVRLWTEEEVPSAYDGDHGYLGCKILDPEECYLSSEVCHDVRTAMSRLPRHYARALVMREYQGMSYREIASDLGLTEKAVESLLHRAKSQLRKELAGTREGGWWAALVACLGNLKGKLRSSGSSLSRCFRWGGVANLGGIAGAGNAIWNIMVIFLLVCAVVGSGFLGTVGCGEDEGRKRVENPCVRVMDRECERVAEPNGLVEGESGTVRMTGSEDLAGSLSCLFEITGLTWRGVVAGSGEVLRAIVRGSGNLLDTALTTAENLWTCLLGVSERALASLGLPQDVLWCFFPPAGMPWDGLRALGDQAVEAAVDVTHAVEGAVLQAGSGAEASLMALPLGLVAEDLESPSGSQAAIPPASAFAIPPEASEGGGGTSAVEPTVSFHKLNEVMGPLPDTMEIILSGLFPVGIQGSPAP
ncbi:RNA polymerase sigma factor [Candidatus Solincola tengchongensis]|uniref:RNA polymerase sigma factor n=1 Tax=Candidatus Solincola tengchongensis TaxID=2900693 RepID=UPI00257FB0B2